MPICDIARLDFEEIVSDTETGGILCTITSPEGAEEDFRVMSNLISLAIDPGTGLPVSGLQSSMSLPIAWLITAGFYNPATGAGIRGVADTDSRPWVVDFVDTNGRHWKMKIESTDPDFGAGKMLMFLELYEAE